MREEEEKNSMDVESASDVFCTSPSCERERDFRCLGCKRRLLEELYYERVEVLSVRGIIVSFFLVTAYPASLSDRIAIS